MKKTLTMLLAAAGAVYAQDTTTEVIFSQSWTDAGPADTNSAVNESFYYAEGMDYAIIGSYLGNSYKPWKESIIGGTPSFTLSFDLKNIDVVAADSPWDDIFSMKLSDGSKLQFQTTGTGTLTLFNTNSNAQIDTTLTLDNFADWQTFTLVGDAEAGKLSIYLGDSHVASTADGAWTGSAPSRPRPLSRCWPSPGSAPAAAASKGTSC